MRYRLRTLLILMTVAPPLIAYGWFNWRFVVIASLPLALIIYQWMSHRSIERTIRRSVEKSIREGASQLAQCRTKQEDANR